MRGENLSFDQSKSLFVELMEGKHKENSIIEILKKQQKLQKNLRKRKNNGY